MTRSSKPLRILGCLYLTASNWFGAGTQEIPENFVRCTYNIYIYMYDLRVQSGSHRSILGPRYI